MRHPPKRRGEQRGHSIREGDGREAANWNWGGGGGTAGAGAPCIHCQKITHSDTHTDSHSRITVVHFTLKISTQDRTHANRPLARNEHNADTKAHMKAHTIARPTHHGHTPDRRNGRSFLAWRDTTDIGI